MLASPGWSCDAPDFPETGGKVRGADSEGSSAMIMSLTVLSRVGLERISLVKYTILFDLN